MRLTASTRSCAFLGWLEGRVITMSVTIMSEEKLPLAALSTETTSTEVTMIGREVREGIRVYKKRWQEVRLVFDFGYGPVRVRARYLLLA